MYCPSFSGPVPVSGCEPCANGTYSLGGGNLYSAATGAWQTPLAPEFFTECLTRDIFSGDWVNNCNPWVADVSGAYVHSGNNSDILEQYSATVLYSILRLSLSFVKNGSVTFQYKVGLNLTTTTIYRFKMAIRWMPRRRTTVLSLQWTAKRGFRLFRRPATGSRRPLPCRPVPIHLRGSLQRTTTATRARTRQCFAWSKFSALRT